MESTKLYNGTVTLLFDEKKHIYYKNTVSKNSIIPGVTGVINILNKPALVQWSANMAADAFKEIVKPGEPMDEVSIAEAHDSIRFAFRKKSTRAANIGTLAHAWIERFIKGDKMKKPVNPQVLNAVDAFLDWMKNHKVKFTSSERKIFSKKYNYAGTMDFEATVGGLKLLGDLKTSNGIYPEAYFQTAAYQQARQEESGEKYDGRLIVRLGKELTAEGKPDFEVKMLTDFKVDIAAFLSSLTLRKRLNQIIDEEKND